MLLRIVSQWTLRMKQTLKIKPQTDAKIWTNLGKSNPKIWPSFKYINLSRIQRPCIKIQCAKKLIVAEFWGPHKCTLLKIMIQNLSTHENGDKRAPPWKIQIFKIKNFEEFRISSLVQFFYRSKRTFQKALIWKTEAGAKFLARRKPVGKGKARWHKAHTF